MLSMCLGLGADIVLGESLTELAVARGHGVEGRASLRSGSINSIRTLDRSDRGIFKLDRIQPS